MSEQKNWGSGRPGFLKGTCPVEEYLKAKTELAGYKYFGVSDQSGDLGEIEQRSGSIKTRTKSEAEIRHYPARKQYQEGMGIDVFEVALSDEIVPFALPEEL